MSEIGDLSRPFAIPMGPQVGKPVRRRPADEDRAGGLNTLTRFADIDLATPGFDPGDECDQPCCNPKEAA